MMKFAWVLQPASAGSSGCCGAAAVSHQHALRSTKCGGQVALYICAGHVVAADGQHVSDTSKMMQALMHADGGWFLCLLKAVCLYAAMSEPAFLGVPETV
jgi:hypothetical protein